MGFGMQWHQLDHMQTICTSLQTDNHTNTSSLIITGPRMWNSLPATIRQVTSYGQFRQHLKIHLFTA